MLVLDSVIPSVSYSLEVLNLHDVKNNIISTYTSRNAMDSINTVVDKVKKTYYSKFDVPNSLYNYEYVTILKDGDDTILLDGFKRLFISENVPNINVPVRIYDKSSLSDTNLIKLLLSLNTHKFDDYGRSFYTNGFTVLFSVLFNMNVGAWFLHSIGNESLNYNKVESVMMNERFFDTFKFIGGLVSNYNNISSNDFVLSSLREMLYSVDINDLELLKDSILEYVSSDSFTKLTKGERLLSDTETAKNRSKNIINGINNIFDSKIGKDVFDFDAELKKYNDTIKELAKTSIKIAINNEEKVLCELIDYNKRSLIPSNGIDVDVLIVPKPNSLVKEHLKSFVVKMKLCKSSGYDYYLSFDKNGYDFDTYKIILNIFNRKTIEYVKCGEHRHDGIKISYSKFILTDISHIMK